MQVNRVSMNQRFRENDLISNKRSKEDGKVLRCLLECNQVIYEVAVPLNRYGWEAGAVKALWADSEVQLASNTQLR